MNDVVVREDAPDQEEGTIGRTKPPGRPESFIRVDHDSGVRRETHQTSRITRFACAAIVRLIVGLLPSRPEGGGASVERDEWPAVIGEDSFAHAPISPVSRWPEQAPRRRAARNSSTTATDVDAITSHELSGPNIPPVSQSGPA